ncbi:MAG: hypothetical protein NTY09_05375 [bacterium]|nr:hypothetical protein [bacterium]
MSSTAKRRRSTPLEVLIHLMMAPGSGGTFSWQPAPDHLRRFADDLRWTILRKVYSELNGKTPYSGLIQKHAIRVESLDLPFFMDCLEVIRDKNSRSFRISEVRRLSEIELIRQFFLPVILEWAENERSVSVSRENTPSIEDLITHEDSSGNIYQRFPDEFAWAVNRFSPSLEPEQPREIPDEMRDFVRRVASELTKSLRNFLDNGKQEKYIILMARLEDNICTWEMTFDYLNSLGMNRYTNWKSLSVVANRAMREFIDNLPDEVTELLHQNDPSLTKEEKHDRLRLAVTAALEIDPLPSPREMLSRVG